MRLQTATHMACTQKHVAFWSACVPSFDRRVRAQGGVEWGRGQCSFLHDLGCQFEALCLHAQQLKANLFALFVHVLFTLSYTHPKEYSLEPFRL